MTAALHWAWLSRERLLADFYGGWGRHISRDGPLGKRLRVAPVSKLEFRCRSVSAISGAQSTRGAAHADIFKEITNDATPRKNGVVHRRRKSLRDRKVAGVRYRLQTPAARVSVPRLSAAGVLLHRSGGRSGVFLDPALDRLARLQWLHGRHEGHQGIRRSDRPPQGEGQPGYRACRQCHGDCKSPPPHGAVLGRRRLSFARRGGAAL